MHVKKSKFVKITCILVFSDNNSFVRKCSICNCEINTLYTNDMYANERLPNNRPKEGAKILSPLRIRFNCRCYFYLLHTLNSLSYLNY